MARLESSGFLVTTLIEQNRAIPAIAIIYSEAFYHGSLVNGAGTSVEERPLARKLLEFNEKNYQKKSSVIYLDVRNKEVQKTATNGSIYNEQNLVTRTDLAFKLMQELGVAAKDIACLSFYTAQVRLYQSAVERMDQKYKQLQCS
ncbi:hypothetical protein GJ744_009226 [Endocarpon pusillum]|uniref:DNA2/NAM7 helicase-like C-terminal domain-containing protein n=1 Tax=Endocarpon pusillum TaxID=364733 RepID=A0A8H7E542_9EURO|nr:hypothetical protein GJ744_009226 [Endocarpon pusillum]